MDFSKFGQKFTADSGILQLMDDLGSALKSDRTLIMLGGGNPSQIPEVQHHFRERMNRLLADGTSFEQLIGGYGPPQGDHEFAEALAALLKAEAGWNITSRNIVLTNGSQTAFFCLFNLLAGTFADGRHKRILLPLAPEYIGYLDLGLTEEFFVAGRPTFEFVDDHTFKYRVNFASLPDLDNIGAICISRPTNPTGNVLTDGEVETLDALAKSHHIPLIIDNAYGAPFPAIIFGQGQAIWNENIILCLSLSKLGLPGLRTGIVIAAEPICAALSGMNAIMSLAPGNMGALLALDMVKSGEIIRLSRELITPFYRQKAEQAIAQLHTALAGVDYYIHKAEGAFFLWLWFKGLPITSQELYERLKMRGVIVVPGQYFFPGVSEAWQHKYECIRMNYAGDASTVNEGIEIIGQEVKRAYDS